MKIYFLFIIILLNINNCFSSDIEEKNFQKSFPIIRLPSDEKDPECGYGAEYKEDRGPEYIKYLSPSMKVTVSGGSGSGSIVYYDESENYAYVATCGHLWNHGVLMNDQAKAKKLKCYLTFWYQNNEKLKDPKRYEAEVLFYSYVEGCDTALLRFSPDYVPNFFRLASKNYNYVKGAKVHSIGCDGAKEVAHYDMELIGIKGNNLIATLNSPRPGRSGGGLIDEKGYYIGTCWGTTSTEANGVGYFTPLKVIYDFWKKNNYEYLFLSKDSQKLRIYDAVNKKFLKDNTNNILMPNLNF